MYTSLGLNGLKADMSVENKEKQKHINKLLTFIQLLHYYN